MTMWEDEIEPDSDLMIYQSKSKPFTRETKKARATERIENLKLASATAWFRSLS
jgi:hypothetical protein